MKKLGYIFHCKRCGARGSGQFPPKYCDECTKTGNNKTVNPQPKTGNRKPETQNPKPTRMNVKTFIVCREQKLFTNMIMNGAPFMTWRECPKHSRLSWTLRRPRTSMEENFHRETGNRTGRMEHPFAGPRRERRFVLERLANGTPLAMLDESSSNRKPETQFAGPLWLGELHDTQFLGRMMKLNEKRSYSDKAKIGSMLKLMEGEIGMPPYYYNIHALCRIKGIGEIPRKESVLSALRELGHKAAATHFSPVSIKTEAPLEEIFEVLGWKG